MEQLVMIAIDLLAIVVMTFGLYFPRHRRRDLVVAYLVVNVGVLAISTILGSTAVGLGLGLGLFGVLSIIRLRSSELAQNEVAYYFAALALGLLAGLTTPGWVSIGLMALILAALAVGDTPRVFRRYRQQTIVLDSAYTDESALLAELERMLGGRIHRFTIQHLDVVNDTTLVDVRYQLTEERAAGTRLEARLEATR
ncbi:MAG: DUF4956 domain-containing protein [Rhodoglobus sp.]